VDSEKHLPDDNVYSLDRVYEVMDEFNVPTIWGGRDTDYPEPSDTEIEKISRVIENLFPDGILPGNRRSPLIRNAEDWLAMSHIHYVHSKECYDKIWKRASFSNSPNKKAYACNYDGTRERRYSWESQCVVAHVYAGLAIELLYKSIWACSPVTVPLPPNKHQIQVVYKEISIGDRTRIRDIIESTSTTHFSSLARWHELVDHRLTRPAIKYFGVNLDKDDYVDRILDFDFLDILPDFYSVYEALYKWANLKVIFSNMSIMDAELYIRQTRPKDVFE